MYIYIYIDCPTSFRRSCPRAPRQSASVHLGSCQHLGNKKSLGLAAVAWRSMLGAQECRALEKQRFCGVKLDFLVVDIPLFVGSYSMESRKYD